MAVQKSWNERRHGLLHEWKGLLHALPEIEASVVNFTCEAVTVGLRHDISKQRQQALREILKSFHPWRKGPFDIFGIRIDAEWRSNCKWSRLQGKITPLKDRLVLDVGCGNGYYMFRMLGEGARFVLGIDPSMLFLAQFHAILKYAPAFPVALLPLRSEDFPGIAMQKKGVAFDSVFSMGVLYHRQYPLQHLSELAQVLRRGGELVLETLVIEGEGGEKILVPDGPYAKMPNVSSIPTLSLLGDWLTQSGFGEVNALDVSHTAIEEQRGTEWMTFESLADFLDPDDRGRTIEGYPAPVRAILTAKKL